MAQRVEVETVEFEMSHGRKPGGRGHWAFTFDRRTYNRMDQVWWAPGGSNTYRDAKKLALAEARKRGAAYVSVQP